MSLDDKELDKKLKETVEGLKDSLKELDGFSDGMEDALSDILENSNKQVGSMTKEVDKLWNASRDGTLYTQEEDSDDTDEEYDYYISDTLKEIWDIVEDTPNNMTLGKKIRQLYHDSREATPNSMETTANEMKQELAEQMELFDDKDTEQLELFDDTDD